VFLVDLDAMIFGMPRALFPALAVEHFHGGPQVAGYLYATPAAGALLASLLSGWLPAVRRQGLAMLVAVAGWAVAITAFGLATGVLAAFLGGIGLSAFALRRRGAGG
jgi:hypothetical protein